MADGAVFCANRNQDAVVVCSTVVMVEQWHQLQSDETIELFI